MHILVDLRYAPFDRIDGLTVVDVVVGAVDRPSLVLFQLGPRVP